MHRMRRLLLLLLISCCCAALMMPTEWNLPALYPRCRAWQAYDENATGCASCCPLAIAAALSARDCLHDGRDTRFDALQIYDCAGQHGVTTCAGGTLPSEMIAALLTTPMALIPEAAAAGAVVAVVGGDPSQARCAARYARCAQQQTAFFQAARLSSAVATEFLADTHTNNNDPRVLAGGVRRMGQLMEEILANGPVVAVLTLAYADAHRLLAWRDDVAVFVPVPLNNDLIYRHCVSVVGWGVHAGQPYWWVQNSYTAAWGRNGLGRIVRGAPYFALETTWYAPLAERRPCNSSSTTDAEACLNNGYGNYPPPPPQQQTTTTPRPTTTTTMAIGNGWILCIAFGTAGLLTALVAYGYYSCYYYYQHDNLYHQQPDDSRSPWLYPQVS